MIIHQREKRERVHPAFKKHGPKTFSFLYSFQLYGEYRDMELTLDILTFLKSKFYTKEEIDTKLGNIETVLDEILGV